MTHPLFGPEIREMRLENDLPGMKTFCETLHPATVAETLEEELEPEEVWKFLEQNDIRTQATIFEYFPLEWQVKMVEGAGRQHVARLIEQMSSDDRADLLRRLRSVVRDQLLRLVDEAERNDIKKLISYPEDSAGAIMTTEYAWLPQNITVSEALDRLRLQAPDRETIYYVYVLDDKRRLLGIVSLRDLILADRQTLLRAIMDTDAVTIKVTANREEVAQEIRKFDLLALPVVDDDGRLVGIVTYDDAIDVVVEEAAEDAQMQAGVGDLPENYLEAGLLTVWRKRVVWLACLFIAELFTFTALATFEHAIEKVVVLSLFIPLCISTGGNSGSQAATLITRGMAMGHITPQLWKRVLLHELTVGILLGLSLGVIGFFRAALTPEVTLGDKVHWWQLSMVISLAVAAICLWGTLIGSMLPIFFKALGIDPAFAASPFVATFVDVTGIVIYFNIALMWIPALSS